MGNVLSVFGTILTVGGIALCYTPIGWIAGPPLVMTGLSFIKDNPSIGVGFTYADDGLGLKPHFSSDGNSALKARDLYANTIHQKIIGNYNHKRKYIFTDTNIDMNISFDKYNRFVKQIKESKTQIQCYDHYILTNTMISLLETDTSSSRHLILMRAQNKDTECYQIFKICIAYIALIANIVDLANSNETDYHQVNLLNEMEANGKQLYKETVKFCNTFNRKGKELLKLKETEDILQPLIKVFKSFKTE